MEINFTKVCIVHFDDVNEITLSVIENSNSIVQIVTRCFQRKLNVLNNVF